MAYGVIHMDGSGDTDPPIGGLSALYDELFTSGIRDGNVAVIDDNSGWCLSAYRNRSIVFGHLGEDERDCHMIPVSKERVLALWRRLIDGDIEGLLEEPWQPGYPEP
jgi:hypothetical protein